MRKIYTAGFVFLFCINASAGASNSIIDSLQSLLRESVPDSSRIKTLNDLAERYTDLNIDSALLYGNQALQLCSKAGTPAEKAVTYNTVAFLFWKAGVLDSALWFSFKALRIYTESGNFPEMANAYNGIGLIYQSQNNLPLALENQEKALVLYEKISDSTGIAKVCSNLGGTARRQHKYELSLRYYTKALQIFEIKSLNRGVSAVCNNIGSIYTDLGKPDKALTMYNRAFEIYRQQGNLQGILISHINIGTALAEKGSQKEGIKHLDEGLRMALEKGLKEYIFNCYDALSNAYEKAGDYKKAYENSLLAVEMKDSLVNEESSKQIVKMQTLYETEKKDRAIELLNKDKVIQSAELKRQKLATYSVIAGFVVVAFLSFFIYRSLREKKKANAALSTAYREIEEKNKDITDSINYARRIQQAMLPSLDGISRALPDSFVLYRPKDVVSGDFYAFARREEKILLAAVDCTGHGVPGAFMSMIGNDLLNQIIIERNITTPALVLNHLHEGVRSALKQDSEQAETRDGMDVALVSLESAEGRTTLHYAGANRPLWIFRNSGEAVTEVKPDKYPIGGMQSEEKRIFSHHTFHLAKGETFYLFTDGFADQFGGEQGKKFMSKNLRDILLGIQHKSMQEQLSFLEHTFDSWKGKHQQVDDVLMIGVRV